MNVAFWTRGRDGPGLQNADLADAYLGTADFSGANLQTANLSGPLRRIRRGDGVGGRAGDVRGADLRGIRNASAEIFAEVATLFKTRLDPELEAAIGDTYPELLEPHAASRAG